MTYRFSGSSHDLMASMLEDFKLAGEEAFDADAYLTRALAGLVGLYHLQAVGEPADEPSLERFRKRSAQAMLDLGPRVSAYVLHTLYDAESAGDGDWYALCIQRSAIQSLLDDYRGTEVPLLARESDLLELDAELKNTAKRQKSISAAVVPRGLPENLWWWTLPEAPLLW